jgi:hypothetical protein
MNDDVFWDVTPCGSCNNVSEEHIASIFRVKIISELGTIAVTRNCSKLNLKMEVIRSSEASVLSGAIWLHIPDDDILRVVFVFQEFGTIKKAHKSSDSRCFTQNPLDSSNVSVLLNISVCASFRVRYGLS